MVGEIEYFRATSKLTAMTGESDVWESDPKTPIQSIDSEHSGNEKKWKYTLRVFKVQDAMGETWLEKRKC